ncbi:MAG: hypothetical protein RBT19_01500 [Tenuifilaceae bacterium]|jgi:hypothetical protein|nr:hypothetical protein [Tenuifilaceae bacterium]
MKKQLHQISRIVLLGVFVLMGATGWTQNTCSDQLRLAQRKYDSGLLDDIPSIIEPCLERGFTKEEKANAYKLLIQSYLFSDLQDQADNVMLRFLREFPEYRIAPNDHTEFVNLHRTYRTTPIMKIEASIGISLTLPWVLEYYGPENLSVPNVSYASSSGITLEGNYIDQLTGDFDISLGLSFSFLRIGYSNDVYDYTSTSAVFRQSYIGAPLAVRYNKRMLGVNMFAKGGVEPVFMLSSTIGFTRDVLAAQDPISGDENVLGQQRRFDVRPIVSVGADFSIGGAQLFVTAGFRFGTINPTQKSLRYSNDDLYQKYYFIPDDYLTHQAIISFSYVFSVYSPKKIF